MVGHGIVTHPDGFGSPIGKLKGINLAIEDMSPRDLRAYNIYETEVVTLEFEGNITVSGEIITGSRNLQGEIIIISFKNCTVMHNNTVLFEPTWGIYDMAVGKKVTSAFSGPADVNSFDIITHVTSSQTIKSKKSDERQQLENLYKLVRMIREGNDNNESLKNIFQELKRNHPKDWLLCVEIAELLTKNTDNELMQEVLIHLEKLKERRPEIAKLISNGLELVFEKEVV